MVTLLISNLRAYIKFRQVLGVPSPALLNPKEVIINNMGNINATRTSELIHISARTCPGRENLAIQRRCADPRNKDHIEEQRNVDIQHIVVNNIMMTKLFFGVIICLSLLTCGVNTFCGKSCLL